MSIFTKIADALRIGTAPVGVDPKPRPNSAYMRGGRGVTLNGWRPALRDAQDEISVAWDDAAARVIDAVHNSGWLSGAIDQSVANTVGTGLRLKCMPENALFGMDEAAARQWAREVERRFDLWSRTAQECDIAGKRTFGQMQAAGFRSWLATGEILAELPWRKRAWNNYGTKVRLLPPQRLCRKSDAMKRLVSGVYIDGDGMAVGYLASKKDPFLGTIEFDVRARDSLGRPNVIHVFDGMPETYRGISPMTPALQVARQFDQLSDATLTAAIVQTLFAVSITGDAPTEEVLAGLLTPQEQAQMAATGVSSMDAYMDMVGGYYDTSTLNVGVNGRVSHLFPGQEMDFHSAEHPGSEFKEFSKQLLREIARCLALTYESATGDYEGATYSSIRMGAGEMFSVTKMRRANVVVPFCQPVFEAWLEEEVQTGGIAFPGGLPAFYANRAAACRAEWRGSPKPQADDSKTAGAHKVWRDMGLMSDEMIANDLGADIEDIYAQRAREMALRKEYGLPEPTVMPISGGAPVSSTPAPASGDVDEADETEGDDEEKGLLP